LCAVDPHAVGAWGVGSAVGITPTDAAVAGNTIQVG